MPELPSYNIADLAPPDIAAYLEEAAVLHDRILQTESRIAGTSAEIAELTARLSETELAYLQ